ncbi:S8 family peptidase [Paenibacillus barcinonensis]|uniref:S8 family peptidase n=1 Tax=Paenibacillus barcinonensis TaxID=198119 RepID=UPI001C1015CE|nr:S8 family peptidase [Paenibacillus barcinonensis]MBU5355092.1 S8 family peptidase [Paenibacillus barcinonensis]
MAELTLDKYHLKNHSNSYNEIPKGVSFIGAPTFWNKGITGRDIVVAVLDSGCQSDHPDLKDRIIGGFNFTSDYNGDTSNFEDNLQHGTHVAGVIAGSYDGKGIVGVAPEAKLLILKVISGNGSGTYNNLIRAIFHAIYWRGTKQERVRIITMSLGGVEPDPLLHLAIKLAIKSDILVVTSSGNYGDGNLETEEILYPAYYPEVVAVGAINEEKVVASFSNTNDEVDLYAPGTEVYSTVPNGLYAQLTGTSMAAPHVAGVAALLIQKLEQDRGTKLTESELYTALIEQTIVTEQNIRLLALNYLKIGIFSDYINKTTV